MAVLGKADAAPITAISLARSPSRPPYCPSHQDEGRRALTNLLTGQGGLHDKWDVVVKEGGNQTEARRPSSL